MTIKARGNGPPERPPMDARTPGGNRCPVKYCTGHLRGELDAIGRVRYVCDDCERRAKQEHEAKFGTYLERLRAQRREREAQLFEASESPVARRCEICNDPLAPPHTRVCDKVECKRAWKAEYQRQRFGRAAKPVDPPDDTPDLFSATA